MKVLKAWTILLLVITASVLAMPFVRSVGSSSRQNASPAAPAGPVYVVSLDANSLSSTDVAITGSANQSKSFRIGAVINSSSTSPLSGVFGWQFGIIYNASAFYPLGDPSPSSSYPDGAASTVNFGSQTTAGSVNWAGKIAAAQAFGSFAILPCGSPCRFQEIQVFTTIIAPNPAVTISAKTVLANVNFELVSKPSPPQLFNVTDVKFVTSTGTEIAGPVAGIPAFESITNAPPLADFSASPALNISPFAFNFNASTSFDPDGTIANPAGYFWDFGDGTQDLATSGSFVTHDYGTNGTFIVTLRVQDNFGATGSARDGLGGPLANPQPSHEKRIVGTVADQPPIAQFSFHSAGPSNSSLVFFDAQNSTDPDGIIVSYYWEFGDGFNVSSTVASIAHGYRFAGNYTVNLTVFDDAGLTGTVSHVVPVGATTDLPPIAIFVWVPTTPTVGSPVYFFGNQSYDPDGYIQSYTWNFGDATTGYGATTTHTYSNAGFYSASLMVTDNAGLSSLIRVTIHVVPVSSDLPPVALFTFSTGNSTTGQTVTFFGGSSYDPDGYIQSWYWSFGDGFTAFGPTVSHTYNTEGFFTVTLNVTDNAGLSATTSAVISVRTDRPPIAAFAFNPPNPKVGQPVFFDASPSFDPDGFIQSDSWSFGDGSFGFGTFVQHSYFNTGNFTVTLTVTDNNGSTNTTSRVVDVQPRPLHDVAITSVNAYPSVVVSSQLVGINVNLQNNGSSNETVSVTAYAGNMPVGTSTGIFLPANPCQFCFFNIQIVWDTTGTPAGNYTISATVFLPTDQNPADNTKIGNTIQVLPPPTMTANPSSGVPGTTVTLHAKGFPEPYYRATISILVTFDDQLVGFASQNEGAFNFTFSIPLSQAGTHQIKALDEYSGVHVSVTFQVLPTPPTNTLTVSEQVGTIYFPQDTVVVYSLVTFNGQPTTPSSFQLQLVLANGTSIILTTQSIGPGMYKSTYLVPKSGSIIGTYLLVGKAHNNMPLDASGIASFEVKQSWLNQGGRTVIAGVTVAAVFGLAIVAWKKGYFKKQDETIPF